MEDKIMYNNQMRIDDLINDAVKNALLRRNQPLKLEELVLTLSQEEATNIVGGIISQSSYMETQGYIGSSNIKNSNIDNA